MNKKIVISTLIIATISLFTIAKIQHSTPAPNIEEPRLKVESLLRRYGREETIVFKLTNKSNQNILFPDNYYGINIFKKEENGLWRQIILPLDFIPAIHMLPPGEEREIKVKHDLLEVGEYKVIFEGWYREDYINLIKGEAYFNVQPHPSFKTDLLTKHPRTNDRIEILVTNDRWNNLIFDDKTLGLNLYIKNEEGHWMQLPDPLHNDGVNFILETGESYILEIPPLRATGKYKIELYGIEDESGLRVRSIIEFSVR
ncbi:hypothetical protein SAMN02745227_01632 [Anaerobranca californiensis DSM 14826]|jgi:hypothetical protein|uniref:Intracellular proteinase inhibitor n=1 Tax=Anaerobranca californiensis DSM 14826 TaxID=1120989 RepID=A0A1M6Q3C8_9FIRM|nr:hypothetical protein [Anaerobranca californiensis]SHK14755.1 hypothetical protein SAMN02745227_01632 [Anaerobranca californiensis DSM 14826]